MILTAMVLIPSTKISDFLFFVEGRHFVLWNLLSEIIKIGKKKFVASSEKCKNYYYIKLKSLEKSRNLFVYLMNYFNSENFS